MTYADTLSANQQYIANIQSGNSDANKAGSSGASGTGQTGLNGDFNFFLTLLTTQLKNQDPTQPLDTNQVTQQIAMLSSVQQQVNTNSNLETLINATKQSQLTTAVSYIGKEIETTGNTGEVIAGQGAFAYDLDSAAANCTVTITNAAGQVVFKGNGTKDAGRNIIIWEGNNSTTGAQEPDGTYTLSVTASDGSGKAIKATTAAVGIVTSVQTATNGDLTVTLGNSTIKNFSDIQAVRAPSRIDTSTNNSGDTSTGSSTDSGTNNATGNSTDGTSS